MDKSCFKSSLTKIRKVGNNKAKYCLPFVGIIIHSFDQNYILLPFAFQVVQEYERAVVFRLGRLRSGGAKGPGLFFVMPCVDSYKKVDLRTVSFDVPPQEVYNALILRKSPILRIGECFQQKIDIQNKFSISRGLWNMDWPIRKKL